MESTRLNQNFKESRRTGEWTDGLTFQSGLQGEWTDGVRRTGWPFSQGFKESGRTGSGGPADLCDTYPSAWRARLIDSWFSASSQLWRSYEHELFTRRIISSVAQDGWRSVDNDDYMKPMMLFGVCSCKSLSSVKPITDHIWSHAGYGHLSLFLFLFTKWDISLYNACWC